MGSLPCAATAARRSRRPGPSADSGDLGSARSPTRHGRDARRGRGSPARVRGRGRRRRSAGGRDRRKRPGVVLLRRLVQEAGAHVRREPGVGDERQEAAPQPTQVAERLLEVGRDALAREEAQVVDVEALGDDAGEDPHEGVGADALRPVQDLVAGPAGEVAEEGPALGRRHPRPGPEPVRSGDENGEGRVRLGQLEARRVGQHETQEEPRLGAFAARADVRRSLEDSGVHARRGLPPALRGVDGVDAEPQLSGEADEPRGHRLDVVLAGEPDVQPGRGVGRVDDGPGDDVEPPALESVRPPRPERVVGAVGQPRLAAERRLDGVSVRGRGSGQATEDQVHRRE